MNLTDINIAGNLFIGAIAIRDENQKAWTLAHLANELREAGQQKLAILAIKPALEIVSVK